MSRRPARDYSADLSNIYSELQRLQGQYAGLVGRGIMARKKPYKSSNMNEAHEIAKQTIKLLQAGHMRADQIHALRYDLDLLASAVSALSKQHQDTENKIKSIWQQHGLKENDLSTLSLPELSHRLKSLNILVTHRQRIEARKKAMSVPPRSPSSGTSSLMSSPASSRRSSPPPVLFPVQEVPGEHDDAIHIIPTNRSN